MDTPKTPPPFRGRVARPPTSPKGSKKIDPTSIVTAKVAEIRTANPALEGKDKRMWARIPDVFAEKTDEGTDARKKNDKVNARVREVFDLAGLQTINAFKSGTGVIVTFAYPADIEIAYAFELVIGHRGDDETAMQNIRSTRRTRLLIVSMTDWAATADVLKATDRFRNEIENDYDLRAPQLLHRLNSTGAWKTDPSAAITEGAKKTNEHESCARDAEMKQHLVGIDNNVTAVTNLAVGIGRRQEELGRLPALAEADTSRLPLLALILTCPWHATFKHPLDEAEHEEARADIARLKIDDPSRRKTSNASWAILPALHPPIPTSLHLHLPPPRRHQIEPVEARRCCNPVFHVRPQCEWPGHSAKLHHINSAITTRNPHAFTLTESKTNTKTGPNLPNGDYNIFEELGVQADNHHLYNGVTAAALRGRVVAVDIILQANDSSSFTYRVIGAYAPWDPGTPATRDFWPELTKLCQSTSTSWTLGGDLNATVSSSERSSGGIEARTQYLKFLDSHDWTSRAGPDAPTRNIIDRIVSSKILSHKPTTAPSPPTLSQSTFPTFHPSINKPRIKFPTGTEKYRHEVFCTPMDERLDLTALHDTQIIDDKSFLHVYNTFTTIIIPASEEAYGCKIRAQIRFMGGAYGRYATPTPLTYCMVLGSYITNSPTTSMTPIRTAKPSFSSPSSRDASCIAIYSQERTSEIRRHKEAADCYKITAALKGGSAKCLVTPGEYIELPITVNDPHSDKLVSNPDAVKEIT
ncbi:hypothetical protein B0H14DRAFT_3510966 [Mycena olivaceomarginata]|nr:hypothetical protein B0H14DRAFT_3510966 [Mycena olivaceomarginata]